MTQASRERTPSQLVTHLGTGEDIRPTARAFELVNLHGPLSRGALRKALGMGLSTVTAVVQELVGHGYVVEAGLAASTGGRPPRLLDLAPDLGSVLVVDIGGSNLRFATADLRGSFSYTETLSTPEAVADRSLREVILDRLEVARSHAQGPVRALAVSVAGIVDPTSGKVSRLDNVPGWTAGDDLAWLEEFGSQLLIDNEANLGALGERRAFGDDGADDFLFVALGAGVGSGLVLGGSLYRGATGAAGEIGMLRCAHDLNELERVASTQALISAYVRETGIGGVTAEEVVGRAVLGDSAAEKALSRVLEALAVGIANAVIVLNPSVVVLGGGLARANERLLEPLRTRIASLVPAPPAIMVGRLGTEAALVGAASWGADVAVRDLVSQLQRRTASRA